MSQILEWKRWSGSSTRLLFSGENDRVIQVNSIPMDNVPHSFAVQSLRKCGKVAKIMVKRSRKIHLLKQPPSPGGGCHEYTPSTHYYDTDNDINCYHDEVWEHTSDSKGYLNHEYTGRQEYNQRGRSQKRHSPSPERSRREDSSQRVLNTSTESQITHQRYHNRGHIPGDSYHTEDNTKRGERGEVIGARYTSRDQLNHNPLSSEPSEELKPLERPVSVLLVKNRPNEEYGLRLGSQIFIKQMSSTGLAAKDGNLQEGDIILKINGTVTENLSLHDAGKLIEKSRGKLQLVVQRDHQQMLVRIPPLADSDSDNDDNMSYF
ncbi:tight junction protein ZO-2-like isoform X2 [Mastacembelus armatus]|uniref:tight junction protein ZO-2-like isoform X2 n=1 Tax=Mastacembelus armatus TaxID=205130 RepID=UPI000E459600|nr:tight junction protein ZO-2-like isoform X2 [Mastacembelus armatus]